MTYWQRRLQNPLHKAYNENEQATRQWLSVYQQASKDIKAEIFDTYQKMNVEKPLISDFYRYNNLQKIEKQINDSILQLGSKEVDYTKQSLQHATLVGSQAAADVLNTNVLNKSAIDELIKRPWHDANFSDRIWKNKAQLINSLKSELTNGIIQGKSIYEVANTIDGRLDVGRSQTQRLVRTEYMHALNQGQIESYRAKGYTKLKWVATMDDKTSKICRKLNRKEFDIENLPDIPAHPNCRCTMVPVIDMAAAEKRGDEIRRLKDENSGKNIPVSLKGLNDDYLNERREESRLKAGRVNAKKYDAQSESFAKLTNEASMRMRISDIGFRRAVESGNLKSCHEFGDDFAKGRIRIEKTLFNLPENIKRSEMPKYGYLSDSDDIFEKKASHSVLGYGDITIELDDSVRKRTTYTINDSLVNKRGLITSATPVGTKPTYNGIKEKAIGEINSISEFLNSNKKTNRYIEAQYHGDLAFKNDVKRIIVPDKSYLDKLSKEFEQLKNMGIEVLVAPK